MVPCINLSGYAYDIAELCEREEVREDEAWTSSTMETQGQLFDTDKWNVVVRKDHC